MVYIKHVGKKFVIVTPLGFVSAYKHILVILFMFSYHVCVPLPGAPAAAS